MESGLFDFIIGSRDRYVKVSLSGGLISEEWQAARENICAPCEYNGEVEPEGGLLPATPGCEKCTCPFATKRVMYEHYRVRGKEDEKLTVKEIALINLYRMFNRDKLIIVTTICPHEDGNKWEEIDNHYKN